LISNSNNIRVIPGIDFARGIAIFLVICYHTLLVVFPNYEITNYDENGILAYRNSKELFLNFNIFGQGWVGVQLFLVISGFLIHYSSLSSNSFSLSSFFQKRFWRIVPPYYIAILMFFLLLGDFSLISLKNFLSHLFFIHNWEDKLIFTINPSFWSIALEV
jgi:peptidoglycan/LPS O-acetylase OafA/YrhL